MSIERIGGWAAVEAVDVRCDGNAERGVGIRGG